MTRHMSAQSVRTCVCTDLRCEVTQLYVQRMLMLVRWLKQTQQVEEAPIISFMRSAAAEPQERFESQPVPQTALVEHAQGPEEVEEQGQGGYKLTFTTSSMCFAGTNAQVQHTSYSCLHILHVQ